MDVATLQAAMPGLATAKATEYLAPMEAAMAEFGVTSELRSRMWLAQVGHESLSLKYFEEIASGAAYEGRKDLGNTQPGDGKRFKGRGPIQLTGRANYTTAAKALNLPLVDNPPMAADPKYAFRISAWWWEAHGLNPISDKADVTAATRRINGGLNSLADRQSRYERARALGPRVIPTQPAPPVPPTGGHDVFIDSNDGKHYQLIYDGPRSYWREVAAGLVPNIPPGQVIKDANGSWRALWRVGAPPS
jgi:predicted chitinase